MIVINTCIIPSPFFFNLSQDGPNRTVVDYNEMMSYMLASARFESPLLASRQPCRCKKEETYTQGDGEQVSDSDAFCFSMIIAFI